MNYACLKKQNFAELPYQLVPLREQDIFLIKEWRNGQMDILRQNVLLTDEMQKNYFEHTLKPAFAMKQPNQVLFSFLLDKDLIGYGGLVHIDWKGKEGEVSFLVDTARANSPAVYEKDFGVFLKLIKSVGFKDLRFKRLYTETYAIRKRHIGILEQAGFIEERRLKNWVEIQGKKVDALIHGCVP